MSWLLTPRTALRKRCSFCFQYRWQLGPLQHCMKCWRWFAGVFVLFLIIFGAEAWAVGSVIKLILEAIP